MDQEDPALDAIGDDLLSTSELERANRFRFPRDRRLFRAAHTLLRQTLAGYLNQPASGIDFVIEAHGRPELPGRPLRFNMTHTKGLVACVVTAVDDCGVDAEPIGRHADHTLVAKNVFTDSERAAIAAVPESMRTQKFFQFWTLKEAYIKARGLGLSLPLREISFALDEGAPTVTFGPRIQDEPSLWKFWTGLASVDHHYGVAVKSDDEMKLEIFR